MAPLEKPQTTQKAQRIAGKKTRASLVRAPDATALLESDHREVEGYFRQYAELEDAAEKKSLASKICIALKVHAQIEEELFYPAARAKTGALDLLDEAVVEHTGAKALVAEIEAMRPGQPLYDAKVKVLGEQIAHHVKDEEEELFPEVRGSDIDLEALGAAMTSRKAELLSQLAATT